MNLIKTSRVALMALARNKMRSFLTALGIIIGVGAVIAMVSIGQGAKADVEKRFNEMGSNLLFVRPGSQSFRGRHGGGGTSQNMKESDAQAILDNCDAINYVSPNVNTRAQVIYQNKNWNSSIYGVGHSYPIIRNWDVAEGQFFTEQQVNAGQKVCILGSEVYENLFEGAPAIGQIVRINVEADEFGSDLDPVLGFFDDSDTLLVVSDDAIDPDSRRFSKDPALEIAVNFSGTAKLAVSSFTDSDLSGDGESIGPYWIRVVVDPDADGDGIPDQHDQCPYDADDDLDLDF